MFGIFCTNGDSCNNTQFNFGDNTGVYFSNNSKYSTVTQYSYYTEQVDDKMCHTAFKGSQCVAESVNLQVCCVDDGAYEDIKYTILGIFLLQALSTGIGGIGVLLIILIYVRTFCCHGCTYFKTSERYNVYKKFEYATIVCSVVAAVFDSLTIWVVVSTDGVDFGTFHTYEGAIGETLIAWSINNCYTTDASLKLSELASFLTQIYVLGLLEVGFDTIDVFISMAFVRREYALTRALSRGSGTMSQQHSDDVELAQYMGNIHATATGTAIGPPPFVPPSKANINTNGIATAGINESKIDEPGANGGGDGNDDIVIIGEDAQIITELENKTLSTPVAANPNGIRKRAVVGGAVTNTTHIAANGNLETTNQAAHIGSIKPRTIRQAADDHARGVLAEFMKQKQCPAFVAGTVNSD